MNAFAESLLAALGRTTLLLAGAALLVRLALSATRCSSPGVHRACWCLALIQGWLFLQVPLAIPYYGVPSADQESVDGRAPNRESALGSPHVAKAAPLEESAPASRPNATRRMPSSVPPGEGPLTTSVRTHPDRSISAWFTRPWPVLLLALWLTGMGLVVLTALFRYARFVRGLPPGQPAEEDWTDQWNRLLAAAGIRKPIPLRVTDNLGPMLCGLPGRWELLVPIELWRRLAPAGRSAVLRHELAHLRRGDTWKSLGARLLALPHWFNPAAWWALRKFDEAAEWACDRQAASGDSEHAVTYARVLLQLGEASVACPSLGPAIRGRGLAVRVRRLITPYPLEDSVMKKSFVIAVALALVAICLIRFDLVAKQPAQAGRNAPTPAQQRPADQPPNRNVQSEPEVREKIPLDQLRYDGKSFGEWKHEWTTELKPERRAEAIEAFVAFGANGYGEEAARAIVEVMRMLDMTTTDATFTTHKYRSFRAQRTLSGTRLIKQTAMAAFLDTQSEYRIPTAPALEVLSEELKRGNRSGRLFAIFVLYNMGQKITPLIPDLIQTVQKDPDRTVRSYALTALAQVDPGSPVLASGLRNALKDPDEQALQRMLNTLCLTLLRPAGPNGKPLPNAEAIVQVLIDAVSSRHAVVRHQAILGLGRIGAAAEKALPTLVQALRTGDPDDRVVIAEVLPWFGPAAKQAEPALWEVVREDDEMRNRVAAFRAILSLNVRAEQHPGGKFTELAQKLDQRNPADLGMLYSAAARLGGSYREMAFSYLRDIAENADDEAARRAAQEALELARGSR